MVRIRQLFAGLAALSVIALAGCGWSARDAYLARPASISPRAGDGTQLTTATQPDPLTTAADASSTDAIDR